MLETENMDSFTPVMWVSQFCWAMWFQWKKSIFSNGTAHIRRLRGKTAVLSCHRSLINNGVEKINNILAID